MIKLKVVTVTFDFVMAVDEHEIDAIARAQDYAEIALHDLHRMDLDIDLQDFSPNNASGWVGGCLPYGGTGNTTIAEYISQST